jgi:hypothetical protein
MKGDQTQIKKAEARKEKQILCKNLHKDNSL